MKFTNNVQGNLSGMRRATLRDCHFLEYRPLDVTVHFSEFRAVPTSRS